LSVAVGKQTTDLLCVVMCWKTLGVLTYCYWPLTNSLNCSALYKKQHRNIWNNITSNTHCASSTGSGTAEGRYHNHEVVRGVVGVGTEYDLMGAGGGQQLRREPLEGQREQLQRVEDDEVEPASSPYSSSWGVVSPESAGAWDGRHRPGQ
jgi:hypothetical protein